ncbi:MAG: NTE family protein, partial [Bacteroidia bacterium]
MSIKTSPTIGLVLSGGGLKGAAHVGVLEAMQEFGLEATYISGASAGAIAGAFYAAGHSPDNLLKFFKDFSLFHFSRLTRRKAGFLDSEKFYKDLEKYFPTDSFEVLNKELYITATNLVEGTSKVFTSGELIRPILASAAFPGIFSPVIIGNEIYADGGILNNFPLEPVRGKCDLIIGVDVSPLKKPNIQDFKYAHRVMQRAY